MNDLFCSLENNGFSMKSSEVQLSKMSIFLFLALGSYLCALIMMTHCLHLY
jgi:hypothetical protein